MSLGFPPVPFTRLRGVNTRGCGRLTSIARTFGAAEQEILQNRIARLLELVRRAVEINSTFVQVGDMISDIERAFHVVRDHDSPAFFLPGLRAPPRRASRELFRAKP